MNDSNCLFDHSAYGELRNLCCAVFKLSDMFVVWSNPSIMTSTTNIIPALPTVYCVVWLNYCNSASGEHFYHHFIYVPFLLCCSVLSRGDFLKMRILWVYLLKRFLEYVMIHRLALPSDHVACWCFEPCRGFKCVYCGQKKSGKSTTKNLAVLLNTSALKCKSAHTCSNAHMHWMHAERLVCHWSLHQRLFDH